MTEHVMCAGGNLEWGLSAGAFVVDCEVMRTYPNGDRLPRIQISAPVRDAEGVALGRECVKPYPRIDDELDDCYGDEALFYGGCYYDEAMGYTDPLDRDLRIECFRAAELLYRHSAGRGNSVANLCLGYVYSYDRCEGRYWVDATVEEAGEDRMQPYPREERAFECLALAAEAGIPEACYKLGDMYKHGTGCDPDAFEAHRLYVRASELAEFGESPVVLGSVALRLASCFEEGFGCEQSFSSALKMYRKAAEALEAAVDAGETWYEKALAGARAGLKRCEQEMA